MKSISPACAWTRSSTARLSRPGERSGRPRSPSASASIAKPSCRRLYVGATAIAAMIGWHAMHHDLATARQSRHHLRRLHHRQLLRGRPIDIRLMAQHRAPEPAPHQRRSPRCRPPTPQFPAPLRQRKVMKTKQQANATGPSQHLPSRVIRTVNYLVCVDFEHRQLG